MPKNGAATDAFLSVEDVHLSFGGVRALAGVGFAVAQGELFSIIGPNGAGRLSAFNFVSGRYRLSSGSIRPKIAEGVTPLP